MSERSEHAICADGLVKRFGSFTAVDHVSMEVPRGGLFSLLGVNGAGKTTTIRLLTGLLKPDEGTAEICGYRAGSRDTAPMIGLSPQETSTAGNLTVRENLLLTAEIYGFRDARRRADNIMGRLGLEDCADRRSKHLSGGLRRRLSIGMGLIHDPAVLFLDEPTLGLDVIARRELWKFIEELKQSVTVVLTTHYMEEAQALSDRIAVMNAGRIRACGTLSELRTAAGCAADERLEEVFIRLAEMPAEGGTER